MKNENEKLKQRNLLILKKARLSYRYPMLDKTIRIKLLMELASVGEKEDVEPVQKIIDSEYEPAEIKAIAEIVLEDLKKKSGI